MQYGETDKENDSAGNFDLSISDMMSALCFIFILVCVVLVFQLKKMSESYIEMQHALYIDLSKEFELDLGKWNAEIDRENLSIRFNDPSVLFWGNSAELREGYKRILDDFFPRLVEILSSANYRDAIEELRIEGHTAEESDKDPRLDYREGMELSQERTREVLYYCLTTDFGEENLWITDKIVAIGYSKSRPIVTNGTIDWEKSRRVEFRIKTNSERAIRRFAADAP